MKLSSRRSRKIVSLSSFSASRIAWSSSSALARSSSPVSAMTSRSSERRDLTANASGMPSVYASPCSGPPEPGPKHSQDTGPVQQDADGLGPGAASHSVADDWHDGRNVMALA